MDSTIREVYLGNRIASAVNCDGVIMRSQGNADTHFRTFKTLVQTASDIALILEAMYDGA